MLACALLCLIARAVGNKNALFLSFGISTVFSLVFVLVDFNPWLASAFLLLARYGVTSALTANLLVIVEHFPPVQRNKILSGCNILSGTLVTIAPYVNEIIRFNPLLIVTGLSLIAMMCTAIIDTRKVNPAAEAHLVGDLRGYAEKNKLLALQDTPGN